MKWMKDNVLLTVFIGLVVIFIIIVAIILGTLLSKNNVSEYGNRLDGIDKVQISEKKVNKMIKELKALDKVTEVTYTRDGKKHEGRLVSVILEVKDVTKQEAIDIGNKVLDYFDNEEKSFYDIQVYLDNTDSKNKEFPIIGYKHKTSDALVWD